MDHGKGSEARLRQATVKPVSQSQGGAVGFEDRREASNTDAGEELCVDRSSSVSAGYGFMFAEGVGSCSCEWH